MSKNEICTCKAERVKILFFIVKYTNLWAFCCRRRRGCVSSLIMVDIGAVLSYLGKSCVRVQPGWNLTTCQTDWPVSRLRLFWNNSTHERVNWVKKYFEISFQFYSWIWISLHDTLFFFPLTCCELLFNLLPFLFFYERLTQWKISLLFYSLMTIIYSFLSLSKPSNKMVEFYRVGNHQQMYTV